MARKRQTPEQVIKKLREAEVAIAEGRTVAEAARRIGVTEESVALVSQFGRYGYRRIIAFLRHRGWRVNHKHVERIWRREGLKAPVKQPKRGRLWLSNGTGVRLQTVIGEYS